MATVSETLDLPGGAAPTDVIVTLTLAGAEGEDLPAGYATTEGATVVGRHQLRPADTGVWSVDLARNDQISPAGTVWKIVLSGPGVSAEPRYIGVNGAGPFSVVDILTDAPASITPSTYAALAARVADLEAKAVTEGALDIHA